MRRFSLSLSVAVLLLAAASLGWLAFATASGGADFSQAAPVIELKTLLSPYHSAAGQEADGSQWLIMTAVNQSTRPASRILVAEEPADAVLRVFPHRARPALRQVASSDPDTIAVPAQAYGRHAFRVTLPAARSVALAVRLTNADAQPSVAAWSEGALAAHNRQLAVFFAAVAGLIAAALAITTGLAVMTGHAAPRWAALTLLGVFLSRLASSGVFDSIGAANVGGPYGLSAFLAGLTLAAGLRLADTIGPIEIIWRSGGIWLARASIAVALISFFAFIGVPGAMVAVEGLVVCGAAAIAVYLVNCGRLGAQAARVAAPSAAVFALVVTAGAAAALGGFAANPAAPGIIGGFASAAAVLLALAIAAGEGIAILPARRSTPAPLDARANDRASDAIAASRQGVFSCDFQSGKVRFSPEAAALLGEGDAEVVLSVDEWVARIHSDDRDVYRAAMKDFRERPGLAFRIEFRLPSQGGDSVWLELRATMRRLGDAEGCLGLLADVSARKKSERSHSVHGRLSGLPGRTALIDALRGLGTGFAASAVAMVDIDRFKAIHASLGDEGGDEILLESARRLSDAAGEGSQIYRIGGDSFALLLFNASVGGAESSGHTLCESLKAPACVSGRNVYVAASVGLALGRDASTAEELLDHASLALAEAKRVGGGCARQYTPALAQAKSADAVLLEADLREALKKGEIEIVYQPIVRLEDGTVAGFEALLRWVHPQKGLLEPAGFIGHSEQTGAIFELGRFALEETAFELARWQKFFPLEPPLSASVNLSRRQLLDRQFEPLLVRLLSNGAVAKGTLKLELTESAASEIDDLGERLARLKAAGAGLAIDDFGTGLSGLSQLRDLPFDTLKIDKSFLANGGNLRSRARDASVLRSIMRLAKDLNLSVVAEGVESAGDVQRLREMGCDYGQGFYFSPPLPGADVLDFIARHHRSGLSTPGPGVASSGVTGVRGKPGDVDPQLA